MGNYINQQGQYVVDTSRLPKANTKPSQLGAYHMCGDKSFEPQRNNNFEVQIVGLNNLASVDSGAKTNADASNALLLSVATFSAPSINIQPISIAYGNNKVKFAGTPEFQESSIVFNDFIGIDVCNILSAWFAQVYNTKTQKIGNKVNYAKSGYLIEYDPSGEQARQWYLSGCWLSNLQLGEFSQEGNATRTISATLQYDFAIPLD